MLARLFKGKNRDPLWEHFIKTSPVDPNGNLAPALIDASAGRVFPVKGNDPDPAGMAQKIKDLALWWGAELVGIVPLEPVQAGLEPPTGETRIDPSGDASTQAAGEESTARRFAIVFVLSSEYDPEESPGIGGQYVLQRGAVVVQHVGAYIREIGFQANKCDLDPLPLAEAAGLGKVDRRGRLTVRGQRRHAHVPRAVVTNLPLAADD